ncbi:MAG: SDR family oxidoreductase [Actinomycetota bacterium]
MDGLAMVCGATGALGTALVSHFAARGDRVIAVARDRGRLESMASAHGEGVRPEPADLADASSVEDLWARVDASNETPRWLVNAVGGYSAGTVESITPEEYEAAHDLNLGTAWWSCHSAVPRMKDSNGAIVNVSSRAALVGGADSAAYSVSKAGVIRLTEVLAEELLESGLRANAVIPAIIDTPENRETMGEKTMAKAVSPESIAKVIGFLCSEDSDPITGAAVPVYGRFPKARLPKGR